MKISKKSWHYRFLKAQRRAVPVSLCPYFWAVVFEALKMLVIGASLLVIAMFVAMVLFVTPIGYMFDASWVTEKEIGASVTFWAAIIIMTTVGGTRHFYRRLRQNRPVVHKESNIVTAYIKARKEKICPMLEFE